MPLTVRLLGPAGDLLATGGSLLGGATSGLDVPVSTAGIYKVQVVNHPGRLQRDRDQRGAHRARE